jgi:hypothetical protein
MSFLGKKLLSFTVLILLFVAAVAPLTVNAADDQTNAAQAISSAQNTLINCYKRTQKTEASGANVTTLISALNRANALLSNAQTAYAQNNFQSATDLAQQSQNQLSNFTTEENELTASANQKGGSNLLVMLASVVSSVAVLVVGFASWVILNRKDGFEVRKT